MSLVNQVLKDLEKRRNVSGDATGLRAAVAVAQRRLPPWLPWTVLAVLLGVGLFTVDRLLRAPESPTMVTAVPVEAEAPAEEIPVEVQPEQAPMPTPPQLQRVAAATRDQRLTLTLELDGGADLRSFELEGPRRLIVDLPTLDPDQRPVIPVPSGQGGLLESEYQRAPDGGLRISLSIHDDATTEVSQPAPDIVNVVISMPVPPPATAAPEPEVVAEAPPQPTPSAAEEGTQQRTLVARSPRQRADDAYDEGVRALSEGRRGRAESSFRDALGHDSSLHTARLALANLLYQTGQLREAEVQLQEGLRIAPGEPALADRYARLLLERGDLAGAIGVLSESAPPPETHPDHHALRAALLQRAGNHEAAAGAYAELVNIHADRGLWWMGLGISLENLQRSSSALEAYRQAARDPRLSPEVARFVRERVDALSLDSGDRR